MPVTIFSFLIAFFQFFHFGGHQYAVNTASTKNISIVAINHGCSIHAASTHKILRGTVSGEESMGTEQDFSQALKSVPATSFISKLFFHTAVSKSTFVGQVHSFSGKAPLFVLHCNFRV